MNDALAAEIVTELRKIAPEIDPHAIDPRTPLADQLDLDSMDYLRLLTALAARYHVDFSEAVVPELRTLADLVEHVAGSRS